MYKRQGYALKCRIPLTGFTVTLNGTFVLLIPVAMLILSGVSGQAAYENVVLDFLFYSLFTPVCATMMNRIMFASEQLMAAKSAVSRVDEILQEKPLKEMCIRDRFTATCGTRSGNTGLLTKKPPKWYAASFP